MDTKLILVSLYSMAFLMDVQASIEYDTGAPGPINPEFVQWLENKLTNGVSASNCAIVPEPIVMPTKKDAMLKSGNSNTRLTAWDPLSYPAFYDSRSSGFSLPVRNQGSEGTCWAHSGLAALEWNVLKTEGRVMDFSESNIANRHGFDYEGWQWGNGDMVSAYFLRWDGPILEYYDRYPNKNIVVAAPARHVQKVCWIAPKSESLDNNGIKRAIMKYGAVQVAYYSNTNSKYYNSKTASYYYPTSHSTSHLVAIIGWDDNYPKENFATVPDGNGAFIVRNSWGETWGRDGHFYVSYYDKTFGQYRMYAYSGSEYPDNYADVYQYDTYGCTGNWGWGRNDGWGANIFTAKANDDIAAVGFYAFSEGSTYEIRVYTGCSASNPTSGTLTLSQEGELEEAGYSTIPLITTVGVLKGQRFSVVLHISSPGVNYPLALEWRTEGYTGNVTANAGESFGSGDGTNWFDFADGDRTCSFCMKAYTTPKVRAMTQNAMARMPYSWLDDYPEILHEKCGGDYERAAVSKGKNGRSLYDSYVAKLDPASTNSDLKVSIDFDESHNVVIDYAPKWEDRRYEIVGKTSLIDIADWAPTNAAHHFFKVKIEIPID